MPLKCFFYACRNESETSTVSFHKFPDDAESCEKWVDFCQSDDLNERFVLEGPQSMRFKFVCSDHFRPQCYVDPKYTFKGLRKEAIPTIEKGDPKLLKVKPVAIPKVKPGGLPNLKPRDRAAQLSVELTQPCPCDIDDEYRDKYLEEVSRAEKLVKELKEIEDKTKALKKPFRNCGRSIQTLDKRIKLLNQKLATLEEKHGIQVELSSDEEEVPEDRYETHRISSSKQD